MKLLVSILAIDRVIHVSTAKMLLIMGADKRVEIEYFFVQHAPVDAARNKVIDTFLESDSDFLISVDDDTGCEKNPIDLCFLGKDIIFLPTPIIYQGKLKINVNYKKREKGLQEVRRGGTGCFMLSRKAAVTIPKPLFRFRYSRDGSCLLGEDFDFSEKARRFFPLYVHNDYPCHHYKNVDLLSLGGFDSLSQL